MQRAQTCVPLLHINEQTSAQALTGADSEPHAAVCQVTPQRAGCLVRSSVDERVRGRLIVQLGASSA